MDTNRSYVDEWILTGLVSNHEVHHLSMVDDCNIMLDFGDRKLTLALPTPHDAKIVAFHMNGLNPELDGLPMQTGAQMAEKLRIISTFVRTNTQHLAMKMYVFYNRHWVGLAPSMSFNELVDVMTTNLERLASEQQGGLYKDVRNTLQDKYASHVTQWKGYEHGDTLAHELVECIIMARAVLRAAATPLKHEIVIQRQTRPTSSLKFGIRSCNYTLGELEKGVPQEQDQGEYIQHGYEKRPTYNLYVQPGVKVLFVPQEDDDYGRYPTQMLVFDAGVRDGDTRELKVFQLSDSVSKPLFNTWPGTNNI